jgi:hypothetical protein
MKKPSRGCLSPRRWYSAPAVRGPTGRSPGSARLPREQAAYLRCVVGTWGGQRPGLAPYGGRGHGRATDVHVAYPHARADSSACRSALAALHKHFLLS